MNKNLLYRIVLADDHALVRQGIRKIIEEDSSLKVVGEAGDGMELLEILKTSLPDLVIVDIAMPRLRGLEATKRIKHLYPQVKVMILSMHRSKEYLRQAVAVGVSGYLLKEDADTALHTAIMAVRDGKEFFSPLLAIYPPFPCSPNPGRQPGEPVFLAQAANRGQPPE
ncbi:MAG: response regulator transcription factor [Desulfobaccales bacterium]|jgi:DNA-binding NarL/FixJ family response regulator